ncbi:MAG TPA: hypothetical protein VGA82_05950, partial [Dehalococcoidales bacterium]
FRLIDASKLSLECWELLSHKLSRVPYMYSSPNPEIHFMIINVHGDEGVLSSIKEREKNLIEKSGFDKIIGLRDMYSDAYCKLSPSVISESVSREFMQGYYSTIQQMTYRDRITLYFAVMETEAWFLAMYNIFQKIDGRLTINYIQRNLGIDLKSIDPQKEFYRPTEQVQEIFSLCGRRYNKKESDVESITSKMEPADFDNARENNRCSCFDDFYQEIRGYN